MTLSATRTTLPEEARRQGLLAVVIARAVRGGNAIALAAMRWTRAVSGVVTPLGWSVAAAAIAALAVGYGWGLVEVIVLGWAFAVLFAVSALWLVGRGAGEVHLSLPSPRVVVGDHAEARLLASNRGPRRFGGVQLEVPVGARLVERVLPGLPRGGSIEAELHIPTDRRGVVSIGPARTVRADPIGLMRREIVWSETVEMRVQPRTVAVSALSTGFIRDLEGSPTRDLTT
ncbi:MAG TPA: DUF58 domain-containing protein, partial [Agromyces sp.]